MGVRRAATLVMVCGLVPPLAHAAPVTTVGPNVWISKDGEKIVQVESVIAVDPDDPNNMIAAAIGLRRAHADDWQDHQTILVYRSEDGGRSWSRTPVGSLPDSWTAGDPWLAWLPDGNVVLSAIAGASITRRASPDARARLFSSRDGGKTWMDGGDTPFAGGSAEDHPVLAVARGGREPILYCIATHASSPEEGIDVTAVALPDLAGEPKKPLRPPIDQVNLGGAVATSDSTLVVTFFSMSPPMSLWSARFDGVAGSWSQARVRESILPVGFPSLTVDGSDGPFAGRIYSAWVETEPQGRMRVLVSSSDDGATWSAPTQVHADTSGAERSLPAVAVSPDGAVGIVWQDRRHAEGRPCNDLYGAVSLNGGASFLPEVRVSSETACGGTFENNGAAAHRFRIGGGDYQGLAATGPGRFQAVWCDSRTGRYQVWTAGIQVQRDGE